MWLAIGCGGEPSPCGEGFGRAADGNCYPLGSPSDTGDGSHSDTPVHSGWGWWTHTGGGSCANAVIAVFPVDGSSDVYFRTEVRFFLAATDELATVEVTDASGAVVSGATTVVGTMVTWAGDDLAPSTAYQATVSYECGTATLEFATSATGAPVTVDLTDGVYGLDLASGEWVHPRGLGDLFAVELAGTEVLLSPTAVTATTLALLGARGDGAGGQDLCSESWPCEPTGWQDPSFTTSLDGMALDVEGYGFLLEDSLLSGAFAPDGSRLQGVLEGLLDTRPLVDLLVPGGDEDSVCQLALTFGVPCLPCADGGSFCLATYVDDLDAERVRTDGLVPWGAADVAANPACN